MKFFSYFGTIFITKTDQEENDLKAIYHVNEKHYKILSGDDKIWEAYDRAIDGLDLLLKELSIKNDKLTAAWIFLMPACVIFMLYALPFLVARYIRRAMFKKELYEEEVKAIYSETVKLIDNRYKKRILGLSGIEDDE